MLNSQSCLRGPLDFYSFFFFLSGVMDLRRAKGRVTRSKPFPPWNLWLAGRGLPGKQMLQKEEVGVRIFNSVKQQLVLSFFLLLSPAPFLTNPWRERICAEGTGNIKIHFLFQGCFISGIFVTLNVNHGGQDRFDEVNSMGRMTELQSKNLLNTDAACRFLIRFFHKNF